jgi:hypothetical protein
MEPGMIVEEMAEVLGSVYSDGCWDLMVAG